MATQPDWESIERAYRAGSLSIRNIADKYGTKEGTIRSRAKKHGWQRDLTEQVKSSTNEKLSRAASRTSVTREDARTDAEIIEEASTEAASVVLAHRTELAEWRMIASRLCVALSGMKIGEDNHDKFARSLNAGVDAQLKVIKGERQAYNLDAAEGDKDTNALSELMDALSNEA
ncbi:hypothetical protein MHM84_03655 [Halomonas sp. McH1-25]|uniref:hypothetical protein n=1 Tax=unclassified Halomonas TaxID=2609666 RepID=UPI001EF60067|nr:MULTISPECIES: hypothetical protein [unclassified Halomonas]MCG7598868.1 hypothetical protein [Halomonas sp. McH1-25]MCP1340831.1 hypothetical protein [Halomonas sp. FL8]MCP1361286.1 hypothetical protein [Halomonas sp. BBD45]MCP1363687.1 hypothetical protein [Halomonas sp. BBD48]